MRELGRVVAMGGGTGLPAVLEALKPRCDDPMAEGCQISAIVTVTDDGGSSGRLRRGMGSLPPGDIRKCLVALSDAPEVMRDLFQYRFTGGDLEGHSLGNLLIAALADVTGDFATALSHVHDILAIRGRIYPSTLDSVQLLAERTDGSVVLGEHALPIPGKAVRRLKLHPDQCSALPEACRVLEDADLVLLGPGSLFTSVLPNLLVRDLADSLRATSGLKVYLCNLTTQPGETDGFTASQHVKTLMVHVGPWVCDTVLCNTTPLPPGLSAQYSQSQSQAVEIDLPALHDLGCRVVGADLLAEGSYARHDPRKLKEVLVELVKKRVEVS